MGLNHGRGRGIGSRRHTEEADLTVPDSKTWGLRERGVCTDHLCRHGEKKRSTFGEGTKTQRALLEMLSVLPETSRQRQWCPERSGQEWREMWSGWDKGQNRRERGPEAGSSTHQNYDPPKKPQLCCFLLPLDNSH